MPQPVNVKHPFLMENAPYFRLARLSVAGGPRYIAENLKQHPRETLKGFESRKMSAFHVNLCSKVISVLTNHITGRITRNFDGLTESVRDDYLTAIDFEDTVDEFMGRMIAEFLTTGNAFAMADSVENDRAYLIGFGYPDIANYGRKTKGAGLRFIDLIRADGVYRYQGGEVFRTSVKNYNSESPDFGKAVYTFQDGGEMPLAAVSRKMEGNLGMFRDAVFINRAQFNLYSSITKQLFETGFLMMAIPGQFGSGKNGSDKFDIDTSPYVRTMPGTNELPSYISPPLDHLNFYLEYISHLSDQLLSTLNIYREQNVTNQSGLSKSYDFSIMANNLSALSQKFEAFEKSLWKQLARFDSRLKPEKITVNYPHDFDIKSLKEELEEIFSVYHMNISESFNKILEKRVANKFLSGEEDKATVNKEIEEKDHFVTVTHEFED